MFGGNQRRFNRRSGDGGGSQATMKIAALDYTWTRSSERRDLLARFDLVIFNWLRSHATGSNSPSASTFMTSIRAINPATKFFQYYIITEIEDALTSGDDKFPLYSTINTNNWFLRSAAGNKVQWSDDFGAVDLNFSAYTTADAQGKRVPQASVDFWKQYYWDLMPELDGVFCDNVFDGPRRAISLPTNTTGDWNLDGTNDLITNTTIKAAFRAGTKDLWDRTRVAKPAFEVIGNTDHSCNQAEYIGQLEYPFFEYMIGRFGSSSGGALSAAMDNWTGTRLAVFQNMMNRYHAGVINCRNGFHPIFRVMGRMTTDAHIQEGRYSCCVVLLDNGYHCFRNTDSPAGGGYAPGYFDEYEFPIGNPVGPAWPNCLLTGTIYRREYENAWVFVNYADATAQLDVAALGLSNIYRWDASEYVASPQAPTVNSGAQVTAAFTLQARDGIILKKGP